MFSTFTQITVLKNNIQNMEMDEFHFPPVEAVAGGSL